MIVNRLSKIATLAALALSASVPASAATFMFNYSGSGVSGFVKLTYDVNPTPVGTLGTSPNTVDPVGSFVVTSATGTFVDTTTNVSTLITGVVPSNPSAPHPTNLLAPASFGHFIVTNGIPGPGGLAPGYSYDNLFYPGGSPQAATDYPPHGGFLDIYGLVFTTSDGYFINFWSNGDFGGGATYGAGLTDGTDGLNYVGDINVVPVPEPATWALMIGGFALAGSALRRRKLTARFA